MQIARKRLSALVLAICLLAALAFGASTAKAAEIEGWPPPAGSNCSLTVVGSGDATILAELEAAAQKGDMTVTAYCIALATPSQEYESFTYEYRLPYGTGPLNAPLVEDGDEEAVEFWKGIAHDAMGKFDQDTEPINLAKVSGEDATFKADGLANGIYLIVVNASSDEPNVVYGEWNKYTFNEQAVALPTKAPNEGVIASSNPSKWDTALTAYLKSEQTPLRGSLIINKKIDSIDGTMSNWKKTTFHYHIESTADSPYKYDNWAAVTVNGVGDFQAPVLSYIKAGTIVVVTEVYEGADFTAVGNVESDPVTIVADNRDGSLSANVAQVYFENTSEKKIIQGSGIQNEFTWQDDDWQLVQTPESE